MNDYDLKNDLQNKIFVQCLPVETLLGNMRVKS